MMKCRPDRHRQQTLCIVVANVRRSVVGYAVNAILNERNVTRTRSNDAPLRLRFLWRASVYKGRSLNASGRMSFAYQSINALISLNRNRRILHTCEGEVAAAQFLRYARRILEHFSVRVSRIVDRECFASELIAASELLSAFQLIIACLRTFLCKECHCRIRIRKTENIACERSHLKRNIKDANAPFTVFGSI